MIIRDLKVPELANEITDEEIEKAFPHNKDADVMNERIGNNINSERREGAKWYREELKKKTTVYQNLFLSFP